MNNGRHVHVSGRPYGPEIKEMVYRVWRDCAQNAIETTRELKKKGFALNKATVLRWRLRGNWAERAERDAAEEKIRKEAITDNPARLIADLEAQKSRYDRFFDSLGEDGVDVQATYAYTTLVKTIADVRKKAAAKPDLYAMTPVVMDEFVKFIKSTIGDKSIRDAVFSVIDRFFDEVKPDGQ
jgi:hypothetical protein